MPTPNQPPTGDTSLTPAHRAKISVKLKAYFADPANRARVAEQNRARAAANREARAEVERLTAENERLRGAR